MNHPPTSVRRRLLLRWTVLVVLGWAAWGLGREVAVTARLHSNAPQRPAKLGSGWRFTLHPAVRLRGFLERTRPLLPAGSRVVFSSSEDRASTHFFRYLWASYLRPDVIFIPADAPEVGTASFWLTFGKKESHPRLETMYEEELGTLYRILAEPVPP